jgi:hypothetical protein
LYKNFLETQDTQMIQRPLAFFGFNRVYKVCAKFP